MRTIVGALRRGEQSDLTPQPGVADIERLARSNGSRLPQVDVTLTGDLADLPPSLDAALYRLAQEVGHERCCAALATPPTSRWSSPATSTASRLTVWDDEDARPAAAGSSSRVRAAGHGRTRANSSAARSRPVRAARRAGRWSPSCLGAATA